MDLKFLLSLGSLDLFKMFFFSLSLLSIVVNDLLFKLLLFYNSLSLNVNSLFVGDFDFCHEDGCLSEFLFLLASFLGLQIFNLLEDELFFPLLNFSVGDALHFPFFDLVNDDERALSLRIFALDLPFFLVLQALQSLNFHH